MSFGGSDILNALLDVQPGTELPREGPCSHFYRNFIDRDDIMIFAGEDALHAVYFNSYDVIEAVDDTPPGVFVEPWHGVVMVTAVVRGIDDPTVMRFTLDMDKPPFREFAAILKKSGRIRIHLLTMIEGGLRRMKSLEAEVPPGALSIIP